MKTHYMRTSFLRKQDMIEMLSVSLLRLMTVPIYVTLLYVEKSLRFYSYFLSFYTLFNYFFHLSLLSAIFIKKKNEKKFM
jgi:hypothetical protein